jgi:hypothetical protein
MAADDVYRRVVVEYGLQYVYVYLADQNGKVLGEESFRQPYKLERSDAADEAQETFGLLYDHLNDTINWPTAGD